jgi:hypothetical protein
MAHCHQEAYHAQWAIILDDEFLEAYEHGIVIKCCDGIWHHFTLIYLHILQTTRRSKSMLLNVHVYSSNVSQNPYS